MNAVAVGAESNIPQRRAPLWLLLVSILLALPIGAALGGLIGFYGYSAVVPRHGCGDIGCWDALFVGGGVGAGLGAVILSVVTTLLLRRRWRRRIVVKDGDVLP